MGTRKVLYCFAAVLLLISTEIHTGEAISRQRREAFVVKALSFTLKELASFAVDKLFQQVFDDGISNKLDDIIMKLDTIETKISQGFADITQSMTEIPSFVEARKIEAKLLTKMYNYQTLLKSFKQNENNQTQNTIDQFKKSLQEIPDLLFRLDLLITGKSSVAGGLLPGIASAVVNQQLKVMKSASMDVYNVKHTVQKITDYKNSLIILQVTLIQIYFTNCPQSPSICQTKLNGTLDRVESQVKLFEQLVPGMFELMSSEKKIEVYITDPQTKGVLYSNQKSSIVQDGIMDWEKIKSPQDAGLKCQQEDSKEKWTLEDASAAGRKGYFLKHNSGCFLSIDRPFINFDKSFPLIWTDSDRIDRSEFLICLQRPTVDAVTFFLYADASSQSTTYTVVAHHSAFQGKKYLKVEEKKTSVYEKINSRLYVTLLLSNEAQSWFIVSDITTSTCEESVFGKTVNGEEDNGIIIAIGASVGGIAVIILVIVIIYCCCKSRR